MRRHPIIMATVLMALLGVAVSATSFAGSGVTVALTPQAQLVDPGAVFDIYMNVTEAGDPFNGFDAVIGYDPAALTLVPMNPIDQQQGVYMTGSCGNTFHLFKAHAGIDTITDVLLCSGVALPGPGEIYHLRFQASPTPQVTHIQFLPGVQFYNAGLYVLPVSSIDAVVTIGSPVGVGETDTPGLMLTVSPNPGRGSSTFTAITDLAGPQSLTIFDLQGRLVRRWEKEFVPAGTRRVAWDGRDAAGAMAVQGVYLVRLTAGARVRWSRVTWMR